MPRLARPDAPPRCGQVLVAVNAIPQVQPDLRDTDDQQEDEPGPDGAGRRLGNAVEDERSGEGQREEPHHEVSSIHGLTPAPVGAS